MLIYFEGTFGELNLNFNLVDYIFLYVKKFKGKESCRIILILYEILRQIKTLEKMKFFELIFIIFLIRKNVYISYN